MSAPVRLGVNIDHVATIRNARGGEHPDPVRAAVMALEAGCDGITAHLREDRRHIRDVDAERLAEELRARRRPLNLEMAATEEMVAIALRLRPPAVCLVPERREERTTEGGLDVLNAGPEFSGRVRRLAEGGARVSLFVEPDRRQIEAAARVGAAAVELHTGAYCDASRAGDWARSDAVLADLAAGARAAAELGLEVHAGHGVDYDTVGPIAAIAEVVELNIGHFLIGEAVFAGLAAVIGRMRARMDAARGAAASA